MKKKANLLSDSRYKIVKIIILIAFVLTTALLFVVRGQYKQMSYIGGDEPHYIMMTDSLIKDGDFNLKNDYEQSRALAYYPVPGLFPHIAVIVDYMQSDKWYSMHTIGLPILLAIPYKLFGLVGARLMILVLQLLSVVLFLKILERYLHDKYRVVIGMVILYCCTFFWQNMGGIFPDLVFVSIVGAAILLFARKDIVSNIGFVLLLCVGVLVHSKVLVLVGPIYIAHQLLLLTSTGLSAWLKRYSTYVLVTVLFAIMYSSFLYVSYGVYLPSQLYGSKGQLFAGNILSNSAAVLLDRTKGLVVYFPVILIAGPYLYIAIRRLKDYLLLFAKQLRIPQTAYLSVGLSIGLLALLITQLGFDDWSGSFSPNGRYMLVFIFAMIFIIAKYIDYKNKIELFVVGSASIVSALISIVIARKLDIYLDTGMESVVTTRFEIFKAFPLYPLVIRTVTSAQLYRSIIIVVLIVAFNILLYKVYTNKKLKKIFSIKGIGNT